MFEAKEDGYYVFVASADKGSRFYLNNQLTMNWAQPSGDLTESYILPLKKGFYNFRLDYLHPTEDTRLQVSYLTPSAMQSKNPAPLPLDVQYSIR